MNLWSFVLVSRADHEIRGKATVASLPRYFDSLLAAEFVGIEQLAMFETMLVNKFGYFDIEAAILGDFHEALFAPPFDGVDSVTGLTQAESRLSDVIQSKLVTQSLFHFDKEVEASQLTR